MALSLYAHSGSLSSAKMRSSRRHEPESVPRRDKSIVPRVRCRARPVPTTCASTTPSAPAVRWRRFSVCRSSPAGTYSSRGEVAVRPAPSSRPHHRPRAARERPRRALPLQRCQAPVRHPALALRSRAEPGPRAAGPSPPHLRTRFPIKSTRDGSNLGSGRTGAPLTHFRS